MSVENYSCGIFCTATFVPRILCHFMQNSFCHRDLFWTSRNLLRLNMTSDILWSVIEYLHHINAKRLPPFYLSLVCYFVIKLQFSFVSITISALIHKFYSIAWVLLRYRRELYSHETKKTHSDNLLLLRTNFDICISW